jgi:hypothetical protein
VPTTYDVFAEIIEHAPCKARDLPFKTPVYAHLQTLIEKGLITKTDGNYFSLKNAKTQALFKIIKYCLKNGLDYNTFLSKNMSLVVQELFTHAPNLRPERLQANKENTLLMNYLEENQFVLLVKKRPRRGIILNHQVFMELFELNEQKNRFETTPYMVVEEEVLSIKTSPTTAFDDNVYQFLSGSAQLEGSTVTIGETRDLILNDIYPDKPKKDVQMVKNLNEAMHYVLEHVDEDLTTDHLRELNKIVLFSLHRNAGKYKTTHNKIQGNPAFKTADPRQVPGLLQTYCENVQHIKTRDACAEQLGYIHNELQHIHPFSDGNSRTTRMVLNWLLLKNKLPLLVIKMGCFDEYMNLTKLSKKRDDRKLTQLFHHLLVHESIKT